MILAKIAGPPALSLHEGKVVSPLLAVALTGPVDAVLVVVGAVSDGLAPAGLEAVDVHVLGVLAALSLLAPVIAVDIQVSALLEHKAKGITFPSTWDPRPNPRHLVVVARDGTVGQHPQGVLLALPLARPVRAVPKIDMKQVTDNVYDLVFYLWSVFFFGLVTGWVTVGLGWGLVVTPPPAPVSLG